MLYISLVIIIFIFRIRSIVIGALVHTIFCTMFGLLSLTVIKLSYIFISLRTYDKLMLYEEVFYKTINTNK